MSCPTSSSTSQQPTEKWHHFYNDPSHDVVLKSADGVLFRASRYRLCEASGFFQDLLSLDQIGNATDAIPLEASNETLTITLDLIHISHRSLFNLSVHVYTWLEVYDLVRLLRCDEIAPQVATAFDASVLNVVEFWSILADLSKKDDFEAGRMLLRHLRRRHMCETTLSSRFTSLDPVWRGKLEEVFGWRAHCKSAQSAPDVWRIPRKGLTPGWIASFDPYGDARKAAEVKGKNEADDAKKQPEKKVFKAAEQAREKPRHEAIGELVLVDVTHIFGF